MARRETRVQRIVRLTAKRFPVFSIGTDFEKMIRFVLAKRNSLESARRKKADPGDDVRDYANSSFFLAPLSNRALGKIACLKRNEIRQRLRNSTYPFSKLNQKTRGALLHLPNSWVHGAAEWLLDNRRVRTQLKRS